jgi:tRNA(Ile)-lysidine synthase
MLSSFALRIRRTILRRGLLEPGDRVLVGVSGGADSVALVRVLDELGYSLGIAHLNHALRGPDSVEDERFVADLAAKLQNPFFARTTDVGRKGGNLEEAGRVARREFLESVRAESGFAKIALGHSRDDRTETFLLHLTRGSGLDGLVSMRPQIDRIVRPLIDEGRAAIEAYLKELGQPWRTDATNADLSFARNRMRRQVIPELTLSFNPRLTEAVVRAIDVLDDEHAWMRELTEEWIRRYAAPALAGISIEAEALRLAPPALARRVIRETMRTAGIPLTGVNFGHIERIRALALTGKSGKAAEIPGGGVARREFDQIVFSSRVEPVDDFAYELPVPGTVRAPALGKLFRASILPAPLPLVPVGAAFVDGERLGPYVRIRPWQPGDYYRPAGRPAGKLKKLFQQARIPRSQRRGWPVFETDSGIVWVASFPVSREFAPCERSQKIVALEALSDRVEVSG